MAAELSYNCSLQQAFNFQKDEQLLVGHLVKIKIGTTQIDEDITLVDPTSGSAGVKTAGKKIVGPISNIYWTGGFADPIHINCNISTKNQQSIVGMTHTELVDTSVEFDFIIYAFDPKAKKYHKAFDTTATLKGLILKQGGDLALNISTDVDTTVKSPENFPLQISILPQPIAQTIHLGVSDTGNITKSWGVKFGA